MALKWMSKTVLSLLLLLFARKKNTYFYFAKYYSGDDRMYMYCSMKHLWTFWEFFCCCFCFGCCRCEGKFILQTSYFIVLLFSPGALSSVIQYAKGKKRVTGLFLCIRSSLFFSSSFSIKLLLLFLFFI